MKNDICIIGGGIIGVSIAIELAATGAKVRIIEQDQIGKGCSYGNAGWLTPCFAMPLPMPGMLLQSLKWLANPESPLYIHPSPSPTLMKWLTRFMLSMTKEKALRSTGSLVELSKESLKLYQALQNEHPNLFGFQQKGLLMVSETKSGQGSIEKELEYVSQFSVAGKMLTASEVHALEPAIQSKILGGAYFPNEAHVEPFQLMQVLKAKAEKLGVMIQENCQLLEIKSMQNKISGITTTQGEIKADFFVLATGSYSLSLGKKIKEDLPILGGKGYSMLVPRSYSKLSHPVMVIDRKLAITPHENNVRIAGTLELVNQDYSLNERRAKVLLNGAKLTLGLPEDLSLSGVQDLWKGLRPCTPDGLPIIGFSKNMTNLFHASGHQMLGLQSGSGTGKLAAEMILQKPTFMDPAIFSPARF